LLNIYKNESDRTLLRQAANNTWVTWPLHLYYCSKLLPLVYLPITGSFARFVWAHWNAACNKVNTRIAVSVPSI